jgi:hypothetical protein
MAEFIPAIHALRRGDKEDVDGRDIGEQSDAVLRTAMPGHDDERVKFGSSQRPSHVPGLIG